MELELPLAVVREGFSLLVVTAGPFLSALLVVGFVVGLLQAMTQVHDAAVGFVPRLLVVLTLAVVAGGPTLERLAAFFRSSVLRMAGGE